ncbi:ATP-dependent zinc metalloprotease FtsH, partial [Haemophilus influenzae]
KKNPLLIMKLVMRLWGI